MSVTGAMDQAVLTLPDCAGEDSERIGGKAVGLGRLLELSLDVPPGFVVTTATFKEWMHAGGLVKEVRDMLRSATDEAGTRAAAHAIDELFKGRPLESDQIDRAYAELCDGADEPVAVRSSAIGEDAESSSYAGQQETFLWIRGAAEVRRHVVACWASLFSAEAIAYRRHLGVPAEQAEMAVVVQRMVPAEAAGVMFTIDPMTGDPSQITIESTIGLGMPLVGGEITPDRYCVDKVTLELRSRTIAAKPFADRLDHGSGITRRIALTASEGCVSSLSDDEVARLAGIGRRLERATGSPMDVEWAVGPANGRTRHLFLLQARPETGRRMQPTSTTEVPSVIEHMIAGLRRSRATDKETTT